MSFTIRVFRPGDLPRLKEITVSAFDGVSIDRNIQEKFGSIGGRDWRWRKARHLDEDAERDADGIFVAEADGKIVGYVTTWFDSEASTGYIPNLAVDEQVRGQGLGRLLLEAAIQHFRRAGLENARIETLDQNQIGQHLYPSLGFQEVARQIHYSMDLRNEGIPEK